MKLEDFICSLCKISYHLGLKMFLKYSAGDNINLRKFPKGNMGPYLLNHHKIFIFYKVVFIISFFLLFHIITFGIH